MRNIITFLPLLWFTLNLLGQPRSVYIEGYDHLRYSVEEITVSPGAAIELTLKSVSDIPKSQMAHNWVLLKKETDVEAFVNQSIQHKENMYLDPGLTGHILAHTGMLGGGEQETITFNAPAEPGKYTYVCTFPGHYVAGMKGVLIVQE